MTESSTERAPESIEDNEICLSLQIWDNAGRPLSKLLMSKKKFNLVCDEYAKTLSFLKTSEAGKEFIKECLDHICIEDIDPCKIELFKNTLENNNKWIKTNPEEVSQLKNAFKSTENLNRLSYSIILNEFREHCKPTRSPTKSNDKNLTIQP